MFRKGNEAESLTARDNLLYLAIYLYHKTVKKNKFLIAGISGALLLAIILNIRSINAALSDVMSSISERLIYKAPLIGFRCETVDSLYNDKAYKYMLFVRDLPIENEASLFALEDSVLIVRNNKALDWNIRLASDTIALPESLFNYAMVGKENAALYAIESVERDSPNRYKMRRVQWP